MGFPLATLLGGGLIESVAGAVTGIAKVFGGDKSAREAAAHQQVMGEQARDIAGLGQFAAEFAPRSNRTWWDSLVDGLNRLPRPLAAFGAMGLMIWCPVDPMGFTIAMQAYDLMPDWLWGLIGTVLAFFFGGRMVASRGTRPTAAAVRQVLETQRQVAAMQPAAPPTEAQYQAEMADETRPLSNAVIEEWNRRRRAAAKAGG